MRILNRVFKISILVFAVVSSGNAASFFTDKGSVQVGGGIRFRTRSGEGMNDRYNTFSLSPILNFFPFPYFFVGPVVDLGIEGIGGFSYVGLGTGGRVGFAYGKNMAVIPFFYASPQFVYGRTAYPDEAYTNKGFGMEILGGIIIPVQKHFSINIGPGFWFQVVEGYVTNAFYGDVSITGLIFRRK